MKKSSRLIFFFLVLVSCLEEPECFNLDNNIIGFTYRIIGTGAVDKIVFSGITIDANDTVIFNTNFNGSTFSMPLDLFHDNMTMTFQNPAGNDTVSVNYNVQSQFVSEACGPRFVMSGLNIGHHTFDSMRVTQPVPGSNSQAKNIEIFRCPVNNFITIAFYQLYSSATPSTPLTHSFQKIDADYGQVFYQGASASSVTLPVNLDVPATKFSLYSNGIEKFISLKYVLNDTVRYRPCGNQTFVEEIKIDGASYDSVSIDRDARGNLKDFATDPAQTNIRIYQCPTTNQVQIAFKKPSGSTTVANTVSLKSITTDYSQAVFYAGSSVSTVVLPLNPLSDNTTFFIGYADGKADTVALSYTRRLHTIFPACGEQTVFSRMKESADLANVTILKTDSVTFPVVTNLEIFP